MTLRILLVDDNAKFLRSVRKCLTTVAGTEVVAEAHDGTQALALAQSLQPDLVLLDIAMPGPSGLDVARTMQHWARVPRVVFLTLYDSGLYRAEAQALGALGLVGKANFVTDLLPLIGSLVAEPDFQERP